MSSKKILQGICSVCGDKASSHSHYGAKVCFSCRAFFRRLAAKGKIPQINTCNGLRSPTGNCPINLKTRHLCSFCRYQKCQINGMEVKLVMSKDEIAERHEKAKDVRLTGVPSGKLPLTTYELRVKEYQKDHLQKTDDEKLLSDEEETFLMDLISSDSKQNELIVQLDFKEL